MKNITLLILCLFLFAGANAQTDSSMAVDPHKALLLFIGFGGGYNDYKNLNGVLKDNNLPTVGKFTLTNLLEINTRRDHLLIGIAGGMGLSYRRPDDYNVFLANFNGQLQVAYYVANNNTFHFAPQVGFGFFSSIVNHAQRSDIEDFNELIEGKNSISIRQTAPMLDFCLRFDMADFTKATSGAGSIKVGYKLGLSKRGWGIDASNNSSLDNSPEDRISQFYITASVGVSLLKPLHMKEHMKNMH